MPALLQRRNLMQKPRLEKSRLVAAVNGNGGQRALPAERNALRQTAVRPVLQPSSKLRQLLQGGKRHQGLRGLSWAFNGRVIFIDRTAFEKLDAIERKEITKQARRECFKPYFSTGRKKH